MEEHDLDTQFQEAYIKASNSPVTLPQDVMLTLYAYYKQATYKELQDYREYDHTNLIDAFKMNAWMQVRHLSQDEAKRCYIEMINTLLNTK